MNKREFIKVSGLVAAGAAMGSFWKCSPSEQTRDKTTENARFSAQEKFELPDLPYSKDALEPYIDRLTMEIHHDRHHAGYVAKFNAALEGKEYGSSSLNEIIQGLNSDDTALRNSGGGHYNHSLFWRIMTPANGGSPSGDLANAINSAFGSFENFGELFLNTAKGRFGSGWAWLSIDKDQQLFVSSTPNQDNPLMEKIVEEPGTPIMGIDVWEHAYYLKYQNDRSGYIQNWFNIINWGEVNRNFTSAVG